MSPADRARSLFAARVQVCQYRQDVVATTDLGLAESNRAKAAENRAAFFQGFEEQSGGVQLKTEWKPFDVGTSKDGKSTSNIWVYDRYVIAM